MRRSHFTLSQIFFKSRAVLSIIIPGLVRGTALSDLSYEVHLSFITFCLSDDKNSSKNTKDSSGS